MRRDEYPEVLADLRAELLGLLVDASIAREQARQLAYMAAERIREMWGGMSVYIPKGASLRLSKRDREIFREYNGNNRLELCQRHGITEQRLYQIIAKVRAEQIAKRQYQNNI